MVRPICGRVLEGSSLWPGQSRTPRARSLLVQLTQSNQGFVMPSMFLMAVSITEVYNGKDNDVEMETTAQHSETHPLVVFNLWFVNLH